MRRAISRLGVPSHFGLGYDMWLPEGLDREENREEVREQWLDRLCRIRITDAYDQAYKRWEDSLTALAVTKVTVDSESRILVGHGNPSGTEVGMTVQHAWGAPVIPGSSLKGLLQHHLVAKYGPDPEHWQHHPSESETLHPESERAGFQPAYWENQTIVHSPGLAIRSIFGAPAAKTDAEWDDDVGPAKGGLQFLDTWWTPSGDRKPFATDVLTVHQRRYYGQDGPRQMPNDYDSPVPVQFMTVKPKERFLLAIGGDAELAKWAMQELLQALKNRGVGGKTSAGYGILHGDAAKIKRIEQVEFSEHLQTLKKCLESGVIPPDNKPAENQKQLFEFIQNELLPKLLGLGKIQRQDACDRIKKKFGKHKKLKDKAAQVIAELRKED